jgi:hypothetical protein
MQIYRAADEFVNAGCGGDRAVLAHEAPGENSEETRYSEWVSPPVAYLLQSWFNNRGACQCGWAGERRWLRGKAVLDVMAHCQESSHVPVGLPPVIPARAIAP